MSTPEPAAPRADVGAEAPTAPQDPTRAVARALLYEGYVLWPYRRSAPKNGRRWTFGGVHPRTWSERGHADDPWRMRTECLVASAGGEQGREATVRIALRFLQVVERRVATWADGSMHFADEVDVDGERWLAWDEARERDVVLPPVALRAGERCRAPIAVPAASEREWIRDGEGRQAAAIVRSWRELRGEVVAEVEAAADRAWRIRVVATNTTPWDGDGREDALRSTFASTHAALSVDGARFVSLANPDPGLEQAASTCRNDGWWPILVGPRGSDRSVLSSPIILQDHPTVAPESPGDFFDGGEIDEMLALHILALTEEEKAEMRATDARTRALLDRTHGMSRQQMLGLHGTVRDASTGDPFPAIATGMADDAPDAFWVEMGRAASQELVVDGVLLRRGSRVRLRPRRGGDVMDLALAGRLALIEGIDEDDAGGVHLTVVVEDDPGRDLGMERFPGHRFYFRPEEIEPVRAPRILVAGIGNIFLGDDAFGVEVVRRLGSDAWPEPVTVKDFGIRGLDLAYALRDFDVAILVDATPGGKPPGTVSVIDVQVDRAAAGQPAMATHGVDPVRVLALAHTLGPMPGRVLVVGCEPERVPDPSSGAIVDGLSAPVRAALEPAAREVRRLVEAELAEARHEPVASPPVG